MQPTLDSLLRHGENPFANAFVRTPWDQDFVDVPSIHGVVTETVTEAVQNVRQSGQSRGVLLLGEPGFGKSHLLARFQRLELDHKVLTFVEPPASPDRPIRHLLRETVVRLGTRRGQPMSQLEWLAANFFVRAAATAMRDGAFQAPALGEVAQHWRGGNFRLPDLHAALAPHWEALVAHAISADPDLDTDVLRAFFTLMHESPPLATLGMRRLRGDVLVDEDLRRLGIAPTADAVDAGGSEDLARRAFRQLLKVCRASDKVLVLCVDQIEEVNDGAREPGTGIRSLAEALSNLIQYETALVVLTACLRDRWETFAAEHLNRSQCDRIGQTTVTLKPLLFEEAAQLIQSRLDAWPDGRGSRIAAREIFDMAALLVWCKSEIVVHPRAVIQHCANLVEEFRDGTGAFPLQPTAATPAALASQSAATQPATAAAAGEESQLRMGGVRRLAAPAGLHASEDGPARIEPPLTPTLRGAGTPSPSLDPMGWYFGLHEQTVRDLTEDPAHDLQHVDECDLAATAHELLDVFAAKGARFAGGRVTAVKLGGYLADSHYTDHVLTVTVERNEMAEQRGLVFSSADHFQSIRALLRRTLQAMQQVPGFLIRTIPLRNTYRKSREIMQKMPLGATFIMEPTDYLPLAAARKLRHAAAAGDLTMGDKVVTREEVDALMVQSGVLEENRVLRTAYQNAPRLALASALR